MKFSIRQRLFLSFLAFLAVTGSAIGGSLWYIHNLTLLHEEKSLVEEVRLKLERSNLLVAQFLRQAPSDATFFEQGTTPDFEELQEVHAELEERLEALQAHAKSWGDVKVAGEIGSLGLSLNERNTIFLTLKDSLYKRGFKDYGLVGNMREYVHQLEDQASANDMAAILFLRRHEKDYIIRHDTAYAQKLHKRADAYRQLLISRGNAEAQLAIQRLNLYEESFREVVAMDTHLGLYLQSGILGQYVHTDQLITQRVLRIERVLQAHSASSRATLNVLFVVGLSLLLVSGFWLAVVLSRKYSQPLVSLSQAIRKVIASGFQTSPQIVPIVESPHEISQLGRDIQYLHQTLQEHIAALQNESRSAAQANRAKSTFLASMSHEIRTPLNGIIGAIQLMKDSALTEEQHEQLAIMQISSQNLLALIDDILDFSRIEAGAISLEETQFELLEEVDKVIRMLRPKASEKGLAFGLRTQDDAPLWLKGDPLRLRQVLINLTNNAIKFTQNGGVHIALEVKEAPENRRILRFSVTDTGIGISPEQQERLFRPFTQAESSISRKFGGTGLGLTIARELVELMGGHIGMTSEVSKGSQFFFEVNLAYLPDLHTSPAVEAKEEVITLPPLRILLAEDHKVNQKVISRLLGKEGHAVELAVNGQEALEFRMVDTYDLILMDMQMPVLDGPSATVSIRAWEHAEEETEVPIIALTANALPEDRLRCEAAGMNGFLSKPLLITEFRKEVERVLNLSSPAAV